MKQVTLEQITEMVKAGEEFKIKVNPETSKLVQEAVFAGGWKWAASGTSIVKYNAPYLIVDKQMGSLSFATEKGYFDRLVFQELELIPSNSFKTQQEIWQYVLEGGKVRSKVSNNIYYFKDGFLTKHNLENKDNREHATELHLRKADQWEKYVEPPKWYENIPEQGVLCWVDYNNHPDIKCMVLVKSFDGVKDVRSVDDLYYDTATPVTEEEVKQFIYKG